MSLLLLLLLLLLIFARRRGADEDEDNDEPEEAPVFFFFGFRLDESRSRRLIWELDCGFLTGGILTVRIKNNHLDRRKISNHLIYVRSMRTGGGGG